MKYWLLIIALFSTSLIIAQAEEPTPPLKSVFSFHPIFAAAGFEIPGQESTLIGLEAGGEFRYGIDLFEQRYRIGPAAKVFYRTGDGMVPGWYYLLGLYQQYDFLHKKHNRLYVELGAYYSNFCLCKAGRFTSEAVHQPGTYYLSIGGGWDVFLSPHWDFKLGYQHHILLNNNGAAQPFWGQVVLAGINFYLEPRPRRANVVERRAARRAQRQARLTTP